MWKGLKSIGLVVKKCKIKALFNLQIVKKSALNILNQVKEEYKCSLKKIRFQISLNAPEELEKIFK